MSDRFKNLKEIKKDSISVDFFYNECKDRFKIEKVTSKEINPEKLIVEKDIHRPGLALAQYYGVFTFRKVQVFGNTEIKFIEDLPEANRLDVLKKYFSYDIPCIIITNDNPIPEDLLIMAEERDIPVFRTPHPTTKIAYFISDFLDDQFSPQAVIHGSFVDVYGVGVLIVGKSGIGKSEVALDLIERGHRLVADDVIIVSKKQESILIGSGTSLVKHFMEIRGLGIVDVKSMFGIRSIRFQKRVEVIIELDLWDPSKEYERTGLNAILTNILDIEVELIKLPIFPGKNITVIAEVIALNYLCKHYGYDPAKELQRRLSDKIKSNTEESNNLGKILERNIEYFEHDFE
ncbi:MAG: HPr kinase/phosphorylase [Ignavibacteriae bacterium]|nr:HPr kinase/phosphorylase [Ignavibacteriota bacterium]MCB9242662.1 HPr kinase/phosphorylase [Ignavibacteriales bacterium]